MCLNPAGMLPSFNFDANGNLVLSSAPGAGASPLEAPPPHPPQQPRQVRNDGSGYMEGPASPLVRTSSVGGKRSRDGSVLDSKGPLVTLATSAGSCRSSRPGHVPGPDMMMLDLDGPRLMEMPGTAGGFGLMSRPGSSMRVGQQPQASPLSSRSVPVPGPGLPSASRAALGMGLSLGALRLPMRASDAPGSGQEGVYLSMPMPEEPTLGLLQLQLGMAAHHLQQMQAALPPAPQAMDANAQQMAAMVADLYTPFLAGGLPAALQVELESEAGAGLVNDALASTRDSGLGGRSINSGPQSVSLPLDWAAQLLAAQAATGSLPRA